MTAYRNGRAFAHVMEWSGSREQWESSCHSPSLNVRPREWRDREDWPLRYVGMVGHERLVPWCSQCVRSVQRQVDQMVRDVLEPARSESPVSSKEQQA